MSKNIIIQKAGIAQNLTVDALRLKTQSGGTEDWVPADEKNLVNIRVKQNGTYKASDFSAYGISEVNVSCTKNGGSATSTEVTKAPDDTSNPAIKEGDLARAFTAKRLETPLQGGGSCQWVQKDAVELGTKNINVDNKVYKAADDGKYGYSEVVVSGISITTGTDGDGDETVTHTDGTGTETMKVPSRISVEPVPSFTGPYADEQPISYDGMAVKAYLASGGLWTDADHPNGIIPFSELILPVTTADASQATGGTASSDLETDPASPLKIGAECIIEMHGVGGVGPFTTIRTFTGGTFVVVQGTNSPSNLRLICAASTNGICREHNVTTIDATGEISSDITTDNDFYLSYTHDGKTVYYYYVRIHGLDDTRVNAPSPEHLNTNRDVTDGTIAWTIVYGDIIGGGMQNIPVQWVRPGDYETLEDSFEISVLS